MPNRAASAVEESAPERRARLRSLIPSIDVEVEEMRYTCSDWGFGGCLLSGYAGELRPGDLARIRLFLSIRPEHEGLSLAAEAVRFEPDRGNALALRFYGLEPPVLAAFCRRVERDLRARGEISEAVIDHLLTMAHGLLKGMFHSRRI